MSNGAAKEFGKGAHIEDEIGTNGQSSPHKKAPFGQKLKRHCARFWWIHVILVIIVVLVVALPVVYVAYPNIAQHGVNDAVLTVTDEKILNPAPDSVTLELADVLTTHSRYHPNLYAWNGSLYLENSDVAFSQIEVPEVKAINGAVSQTKQRVQISNMTEYTKYVMTALGTEEFTFYLRGKGELKQGALPTTSVNYNKKMTMKGLNSLKGLALTTFNILTTALPDGSNANGTIYIPNPSLFTIALGEVTMAMHVADTYIGYATLSNLTLHPGNNTVPMTALTNQTAVVLLIFEDKYKSGILPIDLVGNTTIYDGKHLSYYEAALTKTTLQIELNVTDALERAGLAGYLGLGNGTSTD